MRLVSAQMEGFRGFPRRVSVDLDADVVVILGVNGQGKTSLLDGLAWALTGEIPRPGYPEESVVSKYSETGEAGVALELRDGEGQEFRVSRRFDGATWNLHVAAKGHELTGDRARLQLLELLWPEALASPNGGSALTDVLATSVYLQQDLVRGFVEAQSDNERFSAVGKLIGAGRVAQLQLALEQAKKAWSEATNVKRGELEEAKRRSSAIELQSESVGTPTGPGEGEVELSWRNWWQAAVKIGLDSEAEGWPGMSRAPQVLDGGMKELEAIRRAMGRRRDQAESLLRELEERRKLTAPERPAMLAATRAANDRVELAQRQLAAAQVEAAEERRRYVERREAKEELGTLGRIAIRHLGERCPVCTQEYDEAVAKKNLLELIEEAAIEPAGELPTEGEVVRLAGELETLERAREEAAARLREAERALRDQQQWELELGRLLEELGIPKGDEQDISPRLKVLAEKLAVETDRLKVLRREGEELAILVARYAGRQRGVELAKRQAEVKAREAALSAEIEARDATGELAGKILETLREASLDVVDGELARITPLLQQVYLHLNPHPSFRLVSLATEMHYGRGRLKAVIQDPQRSLSLGSPETVLSSSQLNALAVSIFLSLNLGADRLPLDLAALDDPLQSLDDVNLLGLVDLLKRTRSQRQLLISTHDASFGKLLARKLRPIDSGQRTTVVRLAGWDRTGPSVSQVDVPEDTRMRLVS